MNNIRFYCTIVQVRPLSFPRRVYTGREINSPTNKLADK